MSSLDQSPENDAVGRNDSPGETSVPADPTAHEALVADIAMEFSDIYPADCLSDLREGWPE